MPSSPAPSANPTASAATAPGLSARGKAVADKITPELKRILEGLTDNLWSEDNPDGVVNAGVAENTLLSKELVEFFNNHLQLRTLDLTYGAFGATSTRLSQSLCDHVFNCPPFNPVRPVRPEHIAASTGAGAVINQLIYALTGPDDVVLIAEPFYNGFDSDVTIRTEGTVLVGVPIPPTSPDFFSPSGLSHFDAAAEKLKKEGKRVRAVILCNPHNPTGALYQREAVVEYGRWAERWGCHLIVDEIYALSIYDNPKVSKPTPFTSALSIDFLKEAGCDPARVHVVTSASKDFDVNGFRMGIVVSQHNPQVQNAFLAMSLIVKVSSPADALWWALLEDKKFFEWYKKENKLRLAAAWDYLAKWCDHHQIPYLTPTAGHFGLVDLRRFLTEPSVLSFAHAKAKSAAAVATVDTESKQVERAPIANEEDDAKPDPRALEQALASKALENKVFIAPGAFYHHPEPGWFRITYSMPAKAMQVALSRLGHTLGLKPWIGSQPLPPS